MKLLAVDTALEACSVALYDGAQKCILASRFVPMERGQAEILPGMVRDVMAEAGLHSAALTRLSVTVGPGTFTGLRIGLSFVRGMGLALAIPVVGLDTLTAAAVPHLSKLASVVVAHRAGATGKFYSAVFTEPSARLVEAMRPRTTEEVLAMAKLHGDHIMGTGLQGLIEKSPATNIVMAHPDAKVFAGFASGLALMAGGPQPVYLREADAKPAAAVLAKASIRAVQPEDLPALAKLHGISFDKAWTTHDISSALSVEGAGALVAESHGKLLGFILYQWVLGEAEINTFCVAPDYRRRGVGRQLLGSLSTAQAAHNTTRIFLEVAADNVAALAVYRGLGFRQTGLRKAYYDRRPLASVDAITMTLNLNAASAA